MSEESPAVPAVAANAGDSRPDAVESQPEPTSNEPVLDRADGKPTTSEDKPAEPTEKKHDATAPAEGADTNGKEEATDAQPVNGTPAAKPSVARRKSTTGGSSAKKLNKKKSQQRILHLDAQPGEYYLARLKSFPPWPSIICDEEMLPQSLLSTRPVTTKQADGTYNEAYADGGKRVHDRTFPIMFLETNEFAWIPNTDLTPLDPESCKEVNEKGKQKQLIAAYQVAAANHDLNYFKSLLADHQRAVQQELDEREAAAAEKAALKAQKEAAKEEKKKKRKSVAAENDVEMGDAEDGKKAKATKKRKKDVESDGEVEKSNKTPKTTAKLKLTTPRDPNVAEKGATNKGKKTAKRSEEPVVKTPEPPKIDPKEAFERKKKDVLFIRHKLQKGLLSREHPPQEEEMENMATFITKLENHGEIEVSIIRETKIQKVLRAIIKLPSIPREEEYNFKKRALDILSSWKSLLESDLPTSDKQADAQKLNGLEKEEKDGSAKPEAQAEVETAKEEVKDEVKEISETVETKDTPMPDAESGEKEKAVPEEPAKEEEAPVSTEGKATEPTPA
ncbi:hypothetical protein BGW36DRAFT_357686 [Talaromyces proteolyticus]|uniref:PWWP domain-containing protein n=1 Tax=Talaromyces proteolyticus TaxID=1131652 RepID=A0AAD4L048_9EURO|nr:uncharacterized protein BGW36DRAFT_357686 [Talaromyces proteolyticus]KAH8701055.1 hypothetical protein BGW36DRAFT_357686 [Talaromyces proteolyticus]